MHVLLKSLQDDVLELRIYLKLPSNVFLCVEGGDTCSRRYLFNSFSQKMHLLKEGHLISMLFSYS